MRIIGLTGPSGVGKSTMADCAKALGYFVIDCDRTAARVTENPALLGRLEAAFGGVIKNGGLDRGLDRACDAVIAVLADRAVRSKRIQNRDGLSGDALEKRLKAAQEDSFYLTRTGHIIYNNGDREEFRTAAEAMLSALSGETVI